MANQNQNQNQGGYEERNKGSQNSPGGNFKTDEERTRDAARKSGDQPSQPRRDKDM